MSVPSTPEQRQALARAVLSAIEPMLTGKLSPTVQAIARPLAEKILADALNSSEAQAILAKVEKVKAAIDTLTGIFD